MCKREWRERMRALRAGMYSAAAEEKIASYALSFLGRGDRFFVYLSFGSEVSTKALVRSLLCAGKRVCVPRIFGGEMAAAPLTGRLARSAYGFLQPAGGEDAPCDVVFAPLLAADERGYRLGYGGGYYDRYFAAHPEALRVGLAYAGQAVEVLPHGEGDLPLDALVTELGVRYFPARNS